MADLVALRLDELDETAISSFQSQPPKSTRVAGVLSCAILLSSRASVMASLRLGFSNPSANDPTLSASVQIRSTSSGEAPRALQFGWTVTWLADWRNGRRRGSRAGFDLRRGSPGRRLDRSAERSWRCSASSSRRPDMSSTRDQVLDALWPTSTRSTRSIRSTRRSTSSAESSRTLRRGPIARLPPPRLGPDLARSRTRHESKQRMPRADQALPANPAPDRSRRAGRRLPRAVRAGLRVRGMGGTLPRLACTPRTSRSSSERSSDDLETGHFDRGIRLRQARLDVDPSAEHVEVSLLRLYERVAPMPPRQSSTPTTRAAMRDQLGIEPPPLDSL